MVSIGGGGAPPPGIAPEPESSAEESPCPVGEMRFTIVIQLDTCPSIRLYSVMICGEDLNGATTELKEVLNDVNDFYITRNTMKSRGAMSILEGVFDEFDEDDLKFAFLAENLQ